MLVLIFFRFIVFQNFIEHSATNAVFYTNFAFWNALLLFISLGVPIGQNAIFPKHALIEKDELADFYRSFLIYGSIIVSFIFAFFELVNLEYFLQYSALQLFVNIQIQQYRYEFPRIALIIILSELIVLISLFQTPINNYFENLFYYYSFILIFVSIMRILLRPVNYTSILSVKSLRFNLISLIFKAPTLVRENIDIIFVGIVSNEKVVISYAIVIVCSAPAKVIFSNLITGLNFILARLNLSYSSFSLTMRKLILAGATIITMIISPLITLIFFSDAATIIYIAVMVRSANVALSSYDTMSFLDQIQEKLEEVPFLRAGLMTALSFITCGFISIYTQNLVLIASFGFIAAIFTNRCYRRVNG
jgi:hypothetical protein